MEKKYRTYVEIAKMKSPEEFAKEVLKKAQEILSQCSLSFCIENDEIEGKMRRRLIRLHRTRKEAKICSDLIESYGHKNHMTLSSGASDEEFAPLVFTYCIIKMCMHDWVLHKTSTNQTIKRIVKVLEYLKGNEPELYTSAQTLLKKSELPFREGEAYGRIFAYYANTEDLTHGTYQERYPEFKKTYEIVKKSSNEVNSLDDMFLRSQAIFFMLFFQVHGTMRLHYVRECDRIIGSDFFRYLQYKAQVMFNKTSDDQRTRLVHSLEVAGLGKTIAQQLGCNSELVEAIALGHDIGHMAFGHQGEEALDECLHKMWAGRFIHSLQSVKVLGRLAQHPVIHDQFGISGLCISRSVLEGVLKHDTDIFLNDIRRASWRLQYPGWREALVRNEGIEIEVNGKMQETKEPEWETGLSIGGLETQIVYWADKIAYAGHDWDEFAKSDLLEKMTLDVEHILKRMHQIRHMAHGHDGCNGEGKVEKIENEVDLICFIRAHIEEICKSLAEDFSKPTSQEQRIVEAFKSDAKVVEYNGKVENRKTLESIINDRNTMSSLACFIYRFSFCVENYIDEFEKESSLKFFTKDEYRLILDFFAVTHALIHLTGIYPKPYKRTDDVIRIISRYLTEIDNRRIVRSLQSKVVHHSRDKLKKASRHTSGDICAAGRKAMSKTLRSKKFGSFGKITSLDSARKAMSKEGYIERKTAEAEKNLKNLKKWFREHLQNKMYVGLSKDTVCAYDKIVGFVKDYYIHSERVRFMRSKAKRIISTLFEFFMDHEDMLSAEYRRRITFDAQTLSTFKDNIAGGSEKQLLVMQYIFERLEEQSGSLGKRIRGKLESGDIEDNFFEKWDFLNKCKDDAETFYKEENCLRKNAPKGFFALCEHIAKARVVADYIATMTDRYAEQKYNEITSSSTSWSPAFRS